MLSAITSFPGVQGAFLTDAYAQILASTGELNARNLPVLGVLVQALAAAASEIGSREKRGNCESLCIAYAEGPLTLRMAADGSLFLAILHQAAIDTNALLRVADDVLQAATQNRPSGAPAVSYTSSAPQTSGRSLMDALSGEEPRLMD